MSTDQRRSAQLKQDVLKDPEGRHKALSALLAGAGLRIGEALAVILKEFADNRTTGYLFQSETGKPLLQSNLLRGWLHKHHVGGFHTFRRFRTSYLRKCDVPWDLVKFWIGHADKDVTDKYAEQLQEDVE